MPLQVATLADIREGRVTDVYFARTVEILRAKRMDRHVRAEFICKKLPRGWPWAVFAGLEECAAVLEGASLDVRAMPEGTPFRPFEPVLEVSGPYLAFGVLETALLGLMCQASGIATAAARCKLLAGDRTVLSFGARRLHPVIAPMIERNAFIGGCDGVSVMASAELIDADPTGTMPHALILQFGDTVEAVRAFDEVIPPAVPRVALIDTFQDEKFEAIRVAEALGERLHGVRLDTPASRRGNFRQLVEEVRWELDIRGFRHVRIFVSGGIGEDEVRELRDVVDGFGIGTHIADAPIVDFAMDLVEVDGQPVAKRGKWSGRKQVWRCEACGADAILPLDADGASCSCGGARSSLLAPCIEGGRLVAPLPRPRELRAATLRRAAALGLETG